MGSERSVIRVYTLPADKPRRRFGFTLHVLTYLIFALAQTALFPLDAVALVLRAVLLLTVVLHLIWWHTMSLAAPAQPILCPVPVPLLPEGQSSPRAQTFGQQDFWYRWHDID